MKCCKCNASIPDNAVSCPRCGAPQGFSEELIRRARNNDQDALAELYERTYSSVYTAVRTMVSDDDEALDILQDSYLKAFRSLDKLEDPEKFRAWIKRIARNQTIDVLRQKQPVVFSSLESEDADSPPEFEDECEEHLPCSAPRLSSASTLRTLRLFSWDSPASRRLPSPSSAALTARPRSSWRPNSDSTS